MISVIVPIFNVEKYLPPCIESILNQTYKDLEIILVDDGSTDSCLEICQHYAKNDQRIVVIHKENGGQSSARNAGLDNCHGDYISFIDGDDFIHPEMLETMCQLIREEKNSIASCNAIYYYDNTEITYPPVHSAHAERNADDLMMSLFKKSNTIPWAGSSCTKLYSKEVIGQMRFRDLSAEDCVFNAEVAVQNCKKIITTNNSFYYYRQRINSTTAQWRKSINKVAIDISNSWLFLLDNVIPKDKEVWRSTILTYMYTGVIDTRLYADKYNHIENGLDIKQYAKQTATEILRKTRSEFLHNKIISVPTKLKILFFLSSPKAYQTFIKATEINARLKARWKK